MFRTLLSGARRSPFLAAMAAPVVVVTSTSLQQGVSDSVSSAAPDPSQDKSHHKSGGGGFVNPWASFADPGRGPVTLWNAYKSWQSHPVPSADRLPQLVQPTFTPPSSLSPAEAEEWRKDLKTTWLGHACFLVEFPAAPGEGEGKDGAERRGFRVLFDPVWSHRCSPSQLIGPARVTKPPIPLSEIPHIDAVVISHSHYDHLDVTTLKHLYNAQPQGTLHFFAPLGNKKWFQSTIGVKASEVTELDWWEDRELRLGEDTGAEKGEKLRVLCTPCQHRNETLWASWSVSSSTGGKVWFAGDTGYRTVPRGDDVALDELAVCPAFAEIGRREGPYDLGMIPIGAYEPRWLFSSVHCAPEDSVELHRSVRAKKSIGMHWATWQLTPEEMTEPPKRLRAACDKYGISRDEFGVTDIGETVRIKVERPQR
ncbi:hypothetical protein Rhopal_004781-T1 [Rhodotorula paludigena]|uniref:Metallo-beta-lactamase domain-containing protein n=1 Tax=Rhodotorula paludigena TaxID=86838 RepID=A0AAV5GNJ3_9BASI|nr:hypothetical protein Rhopal_004781-T1 [Rhodotorula paludigena]